MISTKSLVLLLLLIQLHILLVNILIMLIHAYTKQASTHCYEIKLIRIFEAFLFKNDFHNASLLVLTKLLQFRFP